MAASVELSGKAAIVTGGGSGLGRAMALALAEAGADLVLAARRLGPLEEVAAEARRLGRRALTIATDVTDSSQVQAMVEGALRELGKLDILVNNAGDPSGGGAKAIWEISDAEWRREMDINLTGAFFCSRAVARHMAERRSGKIINTASRYGERGVRNLFMYCCAKGGVIQLTRSLALSLAQDNVQVNAIAPGLFVTREGETEVGGEGNGGM